MSAQHIYIVDRSRRDKPLWIPAWLFWPIVIGVGLLLWKLLSDVGALAFLVNYPQDWTLPLASWVNGFFDWLLHDLSFGLFTFKEMVRSISAVFQFPLNLLADLLSRGFEFSVAGTSFILPPLSWIGIIGIMVAAAYHVGRFGMAALVACSALYLAVLGLWDSAMITLSSVILAVPLTVIAGILVGIWGYRSKRVEQGLTPVLDLMQTVPVFAYLIPVLVLFGFGPAAAMLATVIYAMPPMIRVTILALRSVPDNISEFGEMTGATRHQKVWKILIPVARYQLLIGVNQVIILSLNMVIIASMIGAGGLGYDVLTALRQLQIGASVEAGIAISLIAITMDRFAQAVTELQPTSDESWRTHGFMWRHRFSFAIAAILFATVVLGHFIPEVTVYPEWAKISTAPYWDAGMSWLNTNLGDVFYAIKSWLLIFIMVPVKRFLMDIPWAIIAAIVCVAGLRLGGWRLAGSIAGFGAFILLTGNWNDAITSVYLTGFAVLLSILIGIPIGIWSSMNDSVHRVIQVVVDVLQTLPSFVYLIPAVMLFQSGDFSGLLAIVAFAVAPAIRYTDHGIRGVSEQMIESARVSGCTAFQILTKVRLPLAFPEILLGVNQTIMMALSMLVITALIGTAGLGQEIYMSLTQSNIGYGLTTGVSIACIAMIADRLIQAAANKKKQQLGLT